MKPEGDEVFQVCGPRPPLSGTGSRLPFKRGSCLYRGIERVIERVDSGKGGRDACIEASQPTQNTFVLFRHWTGNDISIL